MWLRGALCQKQWHIFCMGQVATVSECWTLELPALWQKQWRMGVATVSEWHELCTDAQHSSACRPHAHKRSVLVHDSPSFLISCHPLPILFSVCLVLGACLYTYACMWPLWAPSSPQCHAFMYYKAHECVTDKVLLNVRLAIFNVGRESL